MKLLTWRGEVTNTEIVLHSPFSHTIPQFSSTPSTYNTYRVNIRNQDIVGIATRLRSEVRIPYWANRLFLSPKRPDWFWCPPSLLWNWYRGSFTEVKLPGRESDHSSPSDAEVENDWSYTSAPPICLHGVRMENFTFSSLFPSSDSWLIPPGCHSTLPHYNKCK